MRRILALILTMILFATTAFATETDLSAMSVEELRELRSEVEAELISRGASDKDLIYQGVYIVGIDIKAGSYVISFDGAKDFTIAEVSIFANQEDQKKYKPWEHQSCGVKALSDMVLRIGEESYLGLEDGNVLVISKACRIRPAENEIWKP